MARQKIADYFAQIGIKVDQKSIDRLGKSLDNIERGLHNMEVGAKKSAKQASSLVTQNKNLNKAISDGNKVLNKRAAVTRKIQQANNKVSRASQQAMYDKLFGEGATRQTRKWSGPGAVGKNAKAWQTNFRESVGRLTGGSSNMTNKARNAQQAMYNQLFGAKQSAYEGMDKSHAAAMREDMRRSRAAQNLARIQENVARREAIMAQRTAAIREAGAKRAAAIITAAELKAQAIASRMGGGGAGRPGGRGMFGSASMGGAFGAASSNIAGFLPGFGAAYSLMQANRINQEIQGQKLAMASVMGSDQLGAGEQNWMKALSQQIGLDYRATLPAYTRMMASGKSVGLETGNVRNIFQGISEYGRVMGLDSESMKGTMRAVEQMLNKGQVMSEELKGQLAERMPGVISAMAEAGGYGGGQEGIAKLFKAMENGEVKSAEVMEKFAAILAERARQGGALEKAMKTSTAEQQRFNNAVTAMIEIMGGNGLESGFARIFKAMTDFLKENEEGIVSLSITFDKFSILFEGFLNSLTIGLGLLDRLSDKFGIAEGGLIGLAAAGLMMLNPFTRILMVFSGLMLIMEDLYVYSQGGSSVFGQWMEGLDGETFQVMKDFLADIQNLGDQTSIAIDKITTSFGKLIEALGESGVGGAVLRSTVSSLGFMVDHLTTLVTMAGMVAQGDMMGAAKVGAERGLSVMNSAADLAATALRGGNGMTIPKPSVGDDFLANLSARNPNMTGEMLKQRMSQQAAVNQFTFGDLNMTFSGTPDQMMDSKGEELKQWFVGQLKTAIVNTPITE